MTFLEQCVKGSSEWKGIPFIGDFITASGGPTEAIAWLNQRTQKMEGISDFKLEFKDETFPLEVEGVLVDIIVYDEKKLMCVMIPFQQLMEQDDDGVTAKVIATMHTVRERLREKCPLGWRIV